MWGKITSRLIAGCLILPLGGCWIDRFFGPPDPSAATCGSPVASPSGNQDLLRFVENSKHLSISPDSDLVTGTTLTYSGGNQIVTESHSANLSVQDIAGFDPNAGIMWPGALIQGQSIASGVFAPIGVARSPETVLITTIGGGPGAISNAAMKVSVPCGASIEQARQQIMSNAVSTPAKFSYYYKQFYSLNDAMLDIGASASWLSGDVKATLSSQSYATKTNIIVYFVQQYYAYSVDPPQSPISFLSNSVMLSDVQPYADDDANPIAYVSSVVYGRIGILVISSSETYDHLKAAVDAHMSALAGSGAVHVSDEQKKIVQESETTFLAMGGDAKLALQNISGDKLAALNNWISGGANYSSTNIGIPISYRLSYLKDNTPARISFTTDYQKVAVTGVPQIKNISLSFHTLDDDKDDDTAFSARLRDSHGTQIGTIGTTNGGGRFPDNSDNGPFVISTDNPLYEQNISGAALDICIFPNGSDTWIFSPALHGTHSDGSPWQISFGRWSLSDGDQSRSCGLAKIP